MQAPTRADTQSCNPGWALARLGVEEMWARGLRGQGIRVGHLDTGVDASHPALAGRVIEFARFDRHGYQVSPSTLSDSGSHGTRTASLICGGEIGGIPLGVAPEAQLISGMVMEGGEALVRVLAGLDWMASKDVRVLVLPFGVICEVPFLRSALRTLKKRGVLIIAPTGNGGAGQILTPGDEESVLSVGASDESGRVARFSGSKMAGHRCMKPDLIAPGVSVLAAASSKTGWEAATGTSMASALIAGVAALLFQAKPDATADEISTALIRSARPLSPGQQHRARYGTLQPLQALDFLLHPPPAATISTVSAADPQPVLLDPRLRIREATEDRRMTRAIVTFKEALVRVEEFSVFTNQFLAAVKQGSDTHPSAVHLLPHIQTMVVTASRGWLRQAMQHSSVALLSSVDVPRHWGGLP